MPTINDLIVKSEAYLKNKANKHSALNSSNKPDSEKLAEKNVYEKEEKTRQNKLKVLTEQFQKSFEKEKETNSYRWEQLSFNFSLSSLIKFQTRPSTTTDCLAKDSKTPKTKIWRM